MDIALEMDWVPQVEARLNRLTDKTTAEVVARKAEERARHQGRDIVTYEDFAFSNISAMRGNAG